MGREITIGLVAPQSVTLFWYVVRGSGLVAYLLLSVGVLYGLLLGLRWRSDTWPRLVTENLHQVLQLVGLVFLLIHIVSTWLDTFVHFELYQLFLPFTGGYRTVWLGLGIIGFYLMLALAASIYVRRQIGYRAWRTLHYAGFAAWVLALIHSVATGTDTRTLWAMGVYGVSTTAVLVLLAARFGGLPLRLGRPSALRPWALVTIAVLCIAGVVFVALGPLQRGWAARAGAVPVPTPSPAGPGHAFRETVSGVARPYSEYILEPGFGMLTLDLDASGQQPLTLAYRLLVKRTHFGIRFKRGLVSLSPPQSTWNCAGTVSFLPPDRLVTTCQVAPRERLHVTTSIRLDSMGRVSGSVTVTPQYLRGHS